MRVAFLRGSHEAGAARRGSDLISNSNWYDGRDEVTTVTTDGLFSAVGQYLNSPAMRQMEGRLLDVGRQLGALYIAEQGRMTSAPEAGSAAASAVLEASSSAVLADLIDMASGLAMDTSVQSSIDWDRVSAEQLFGGVESEQALSDALERLVSGLVPVYRADVGTGVVASDEPLGTGSGTVVVVGSRILDEVGSKVNREVDNSDDANAWIYPTFAEFLFDHLNGMEWRGHSDAWDTWVGLVGMASALGMISVFPLWQQAFIALARMAGLALSAQVAGVASVLATFGTFLAIWYVSLFITVGILWVLDSIPLGGNGETLLGWLGGALTAIWNWLTGNGRTSESDQNKGEQGGAGNTVGADGNIFTRGEGGGLPPWVHTVLARVMPRIVQQLTHAQAVGYWKLMIPHKSSR